MADAEKVLKPGQVAVAEDTLKALLEKTSQMEIDREADRLKMAGLEEMFASESSKKGEPGLREKTDHEPKFRTVRLRKYSVSGEPSEAEFVVGWTKRGAYRKAVDTGIGKEWVDYIDLIFLGKSDKAVSVPLLEYLNRGEQIHCKVLDMKDYKGQSFKPTYPATGQGERKVATGEEVFVTVWDPKHGLVSTGEKIDSWVGFTDLVMTLQVPGHTDPVEISDMFVNK